MKQHLDNILLSIGKYNFLHILYWGLFCIYTRFIVTAEGRWRTKAGTRQWMALRIHSMGQLKGARREWKLYEVGGMFWRSMLHPVRATSTWPPPYPVGIQPPHPANIPPCPGQAGCLTPHHKTSQTPHPGPHLRWANRVMAWGSPTYLTSHLLIRHFSKTDGGIIFLM